VGCSRSSRRACHVHRRPASEALPFATSPGLAPGRVGLGGHRWVALPDAEAALLGFKISPIGSLAQRFRGDEEEAELTAEAEAKNAKVFARIAARDVERTRQAREDLAERSAGHAGLRSR